MPDTPPTRVRRSWAQRLLIALNAVAVLAAGALAGGLAYANQRVSQVERVSLADELRGDELQEGDPLNYLIVGVDDASGLADGDSVRNRDQVVGLHTDTIMILRVDPAETTAELLSVPRDLWVPIAETGANQRINTALETGGPGRLIRTIDENFGIPIHHYLQVDFAGFRELVEIVDGVPVQFPKPARSPSSGLVIEEAGCYSLGPDQALGFARARKDYQVQDDGGRWHVDMGGDYSRVERQQLFVELALRQAIAKGARNPNTLRRLIDNGVVSVRIDDSLQPDALVGLGRRFRSFNPGELETFTLPTVEDTVGEAQVLFLDEEEAEPVLATFRGVDPSRLGGVEPPDVTVQVLNGTGVSGQGGEVTRQLTSAGFEAVVPDDADDAPEATTIRYVPGNEGRAHLVARHLVGPVAYEEADDLDGDVDVEVVTGADFAGVASTPRDGDDVEPPATTAPTEEPSAELPPGEGDDPGSDPAGDAAEGADEVEEPDPDDPDDPAFFRALAPPSGADCERTG